MRIFQQINKMGKVLVFCVRSEGQIHDLDDDKVYLKDVAKSFQEQRIITERARLNPVRPCSEKTDVLFVK